MRIARFELATSCMSNRMLMLPINSQGQPDYKFMEKYMKEIEKNQITKYKQYLKTSDLLQRGRSICSEIKVEWKEFYIKDIFNIKATQSGIDKIKLKDNGNCKIPYVTRTDKNNGIDSFISQQDKNKDNKNTISIGLDTQTVFYQTHNFYTRQNIQVAHNNKLNRYNAIFLINLLRLQMKKFFWGGNGATLGRLGYTKILLPIDENNQPNYPYMEQYIKNIEYKKIMKCVKYLEMAKI